MDADLTSISIESCNVRLWEVAFSREVTSAAIRQHLGAPQYVEHDQLRTFGGEEEWWTYKLADGFIAAVCLRVPYGHAVLCVSDPKSRQVSDAVGLLSPFVVLMNAEPIGR